MAGFRISTQARPDPTPKAKARKNGQFLVLPSISLLSEMFELDGSIPEGLRWKSRPKRHFMNARGYATFQAKYSGNPSGGICGKYYRTSVTYNDGLGWVSTNLHNHRVVWALKNGEDPGESLIDHSNQNKHDNDGGNLRLADHVQSSQNRRKRSDNLSGIAGVSFRPEVKKWRVRITVSKKVIDLGHFNTLEEAAAVRKAAEVAYFGDFAP